MFNDGEKDGKKDIYRNNNTPNYSKPEGKDSEMNLKSRNKRESNNLGIALDRLIFQSKTISKPN